MASNAAISAEPASDLDRAVKLLGGKRHFRSQVRSRLDVHRAIEIGLDSGALTYLIGSIVFMREADVMEKAMGISLRTFQRRKKDTGPKVLSQEQSGRAWKFAEILAKATRVLGSQEEAERWLSQPAMALDQRRPVDLLTTPAGVELVEEHLERLEYGVYA
ncbi:antitoxin [Sandarakinorhabdus cyanobacteriorum]|uniref:Antitoxin n=1 Tax=Sandarakinorhabdus cyanobacteriorum TaxID=1981098 RepID=A0A255Z4Y7_9SPHN|nr:antitoxin Xre/MbcA/ParS toxin-binding domain-containing protein [Sandarakinorhabdus cyanobacteriorum]OYQ36587.1 antitoxin [Sandarakinorhabdus cyanobacteriorum]